MFVSKLRVSAGVIVLAICVAALFLLAWKNSADGGSNIFLIPMGHDHDDKANATETVEVKAVNEVEEVEEVKDKKVIDLALSSPQPKTTKFPRGHPPAGQEQQPDEQEQQPEQEQRPKIPDSYLHVQKTQDILDFVHQQCEKYNVSTVQLPEEVRRPRMLLIPRNWENHPILYASNPKSGSTSFKKWFHRIQGFTAPYGEIKNVHAPKKYGDMDQVFDVLDKKLGRKADLADVAKVMYSVVFVRNPLTKLMSGFRDKVLRRVPGGLKPEMLLSNPHLTPESSDAEKYAAFVEGVVSGRIRNFHFTPQWDKMKICDFPFNIIAQTETTHQQIKEIQQHTNTSQFEFPGSRSEIGADSVATVNLAHEFYGKVRPEIMEQLYEYFRWDFLLMGYTKIDNPNFPYLDYNQDVDKEFAKYVEKDLIPDTDNA